MLLPSVLQAPQIHIIIPVQAPKLLITITIKARIGRFISALLEVAEVHADIVQFVGARPRREVCPACEPPDGLEEGHAEVDPGVEEGGEEGGGEEVVG